MRTSVAAAAAGAAGRRECGDDEVAAVGRQRDQRQTTQLRLASEDLRTDATDRRTASRRSQPTTDFQGTSMSSSSFSAAAAPRRRRPELPFGIWTQPART